MTIDTRPLKKAKRRRADNLSRAERELAKIAGISRKEYAKCKAELLKLKVFGTAKPKRKAKRRGFVSARAKGRWETGLAAVALIMVAVFHLISVEPAPRVTSARAPVGNWLTEEQSK
jgi:hypothetical protein